MTRPFKPRKLRVINADSLYSTAALRLAGIGTELLRQARASGKVRTLSIGLGQWYLGSEIIAWAESNEIQVGTAKRSSRIGG